MSSLAPEAKSSDPWISTTSLNRELRERSLVGGAITFASQGFKLLATVASTAVLARLLTPSDFGLVAMGVGAIGFLRIFKDVGLSTATIQRQDITSSQVSNLFWINLYVSAAMTVLVAATSPLVAWFFHDRRLTAVTCLLALSFVLNGAAVQHFALLNRQMRFAKLAQIEISSLIVSILVGITLAWLHCGYWSLLASAISLEATSLILSWQSLSWRPEPPLRNVGTRSLVRFGAKLTFGNLLTSAVSGLDSVLIGRFYGSGPAGMYSRAYALLMRPLGQIVDPVSSVFLPALSRVQGEPERYRRTFLRAYDLLAVASFLLAAVSFSLAKPITSILLGPQWSDAARIFGGFTFAALYIPFAMGCRWLFTSQGRGGDYLLANAMSSTTSVASFVVGLPYGPLGVAVAFSTSGCLIRMPILFYLAGRRGAVSTADLWRRCLLHAPLWLAVAAATSATVSLTQSSASWWQLITGGATALTTAALCASIYPPQRRVISEALKILAELRNRPRFWLLEQRLNAALHRLLRRPHPSYTRAPAYSRPWPSAQPPGRALRWEDVRMRLNPYKIPRSAMIAGQKLQIRQVSPLSLCTARRFDLFAKLLYVRFWSKAIASDWGTRVYSEHLKAFNGYDEGDRSGRDDFVAFLASFNRLLSSIRERGFCDAESLIPVTRCGFPIDGSHRIAACAYFRLPVSVVEVDAPPINWNFDYFASRGMRRQYLDAVALEFCRVVPNPYVVLHFPAAVGQDATVQAILQSHSDIFYSKSILMSRTGAVNLVREIYDGEPWVGCVVNGYRGAQVKATACFSQPGPLRVYVCAGRNLQAMQQAKAEIRALYSLDKHAVHINDSAGQAIAMAQLLLNANSIHFLNQARFDRVLPRFERHLRNYRRWLIEEGLDADDFCIDGSATLAAYGIRDVNDVDLLCSQSREIKTGVTGVGDHTSELRYHNVPRGDLVHNPCNHFYYRGLKFAAPHVLRSMKQNRNEPKDRTDLAALDAFLSTVR